MVLSKVTLFFCQLSGVFPAKCIISSSGRQRFEFSPFLFKWSLCLVIFQLITSIIALESDIKAYFTHHSIVADNNLKAISIIVESFAQNIFTVISLLVATKQLNDLISVYSILQRCDYLKEKNYSYQNVNMCLVIVYLICLMLSSSRSHIVQYFTYGHLIYLPYLTQYLNMTAFCLQFYYICGDLISCFKAINEKIQNEVDQELYSLVSKDFFSSQQVKMKEAPMSAEKIRSLIHLYWQLCEAVHTANSYFGCQLLAAVFSSFIHIVITLYYFFLHLWPVINPRKVPYLVMQGAWIVTHIAHLVLLVWPSTAVSETANETAPIICKLINRNLNPKIRKQLETFLLQLLHHNVRFSALGFFQIHSHILTSMAGSVTTYLVILIQFQTSDSGSPVQTLPSVAASSPTPA